MFHDDNYEVNCKVPMPDHSMRITPLGPGAMPDLSQSLKLSGTIVPGSLQMTPDDDVDFPNQSVYRTDGKRSATFSMKFGTQSRRAICMLFNLCEECAGAGKLLRTGRTARLLRAATRGRLRLRRTCPACLGRRTYNGRIEWP